MQNQLPDSSDGTPRAKLLGYALSVTFDTLLKLGPNSETDIAIVHDPKLKAHPGVFVLGHLDRPRALIWPGCPLPACPEQIKSKKRLNQQFL